MRRSRLVDEYPRCDFCEEAARYEAKTIFGPWAYMCQKHFTWWGFGDLGEGLGQKLFRRKKRSDWTTGETPT